MTNTASLENCKKLFEVSGWEADWWWMLFGKHLGSEDRWQITGEKSIGECPAYDAGFLLRQLPQGFYLSKAKAHYTASTGNYRSGTYGFPITEHADMPENALCKLCTLLFEQGILIKEVSA